MEQYNADVYCGNLAQETQSLILFLDNGVNKYLPCIWQGDEMTLVAVTFDGNQIITTAATEVISPVNGADFLDGDNAEGVEFSQIVLNDFNVSSCVGNYINEY